MAKTIITVSRVEAYEEPFTLPVAGEEIPVAELPAYVPEPVLPMFSIEEEEEMSFENLAMFGSRDSGRWIMDGLAVQGPAQFKDAWSLQNGIAGFDLSYLPETFVPVGQTDDVYYEDLWAVQGGNLEAIAEIIPHSHFRTLFLLYNDPDWRGGYMSGWSMREAPYKVNNVDDDKMWFVNHVYDGGFGVDHIRVMPHASWMVGGQPCVAYDETANEALFGAVLGYVMFTNDAAAYSARLATVFRVFGDTTVTNGAFTNRAWNLRSATDADTSVSGTWYRVPYIKETTGVLGAQATSW